MARCASDGVGGLQGCRVEFQERRFAWGQNEWLCCSVALHVSEQETWVVFRDSTDPLFRGALTASMEYVANIYRIELLARGLRGPFRFAHQSRLPAGRHRSAPQTASDVRWRTQEVRMVERNGQYHFATWLPTAPHALEGLLQ